MRVLKTRRPSESVAEGSSSLSVEDRLTADSVEHQSNSGKR
jgi:hypothetical protein